MVDEFVCNQVVELKNEFVRNHLKNWDYLSEVIPLSYSSFFPVEEGILLDLHRFVASNPIYYRSHTIEVFGVPCKVYEGDINNYWLSSKKYDTNYQPFYPTWVLSAYALSLESKRLGFKEIIDIGAGDGRILYCAKLLGLNPVGIEIDSDLARLQVSISKATGLEYNVVNEDATRFDYGALSLSKPIFFISGLPEMGEMLAESVLAKVKSLRALGDSIGFNFMGSHVMKNYSNDRKYCGWGRVMERYDLELLELVTLPTCWTLEQQLDTPYLYAKGTQSKVI